MGNDVSDVLGRVGAAWGWLLAFGIISILAGLVAIFLPGATLLAIAILFGVQLVLAGIFRFVGAFAVPKESGWLRALTALLAVFSLIVGIYLIGHPVLSLLVLAIVLGIYWIIAGVIELFVAIGHPELQGRGWLIATGVLSVVAGGLVFFFPGISLLVLTLVLGIWLIVYGVILVVGAIRLRSATHALRASPLSPST
jgi:uncharacterized membrane protein HdeD (DUF308 family)